MKIFRRLRLVAAGIMAVLVLTACGGGEKGSRLALDNGKIPAFAAKDLDGKEYTEAMFKDHAVTVLNLWFTACHGCIQEIPNLEKLNQEWSKKDVKLAGICTDGGTKETDEAARKLMQTNAATYTNLVMQRGKPSDKFLDSVLAYPTTLLVDRQGNVVGEPIVGFIDTQAQMDDLNRKIDDIIARDKQQETK